MNYNRVIVIIPMYNSLSTIDLAIHSVLNQKRVETSVIVIDHGSKDGSYEHILKKYSSLSNLYLIRLEREINELRSASRPLNKGFQYALDLICLYKDKQTWIMRLDSDDVLYSDSSLSQILLSNVKGKQLLNAQIIMFDQKKKIANSYSPKPYLNKINKLLSGGIYAFAHHSTLISPALVETLLLRDGFCYLESISYGEDLDFSIRLLELCDDSELLMFNKPLIIKKLDGNTISNCIGLYNILIDHIRIFNKHFLLSKILLIKVILWFSLDRIGKVGKWINSKHKPPVYAYAQILPVPFYLIKKRYRTITKCMDKNL